MKIELPEGAELADFQPCVIEYDDIGATEMLLKDTMTVWRLMPASNGMVELGYDEGGDLVAIRVWGKVARRLTSQEK